MAFAEEPADDSLRPAALAFAGDTYQGLEAASFSEDDMRWAQEHLRILSGLYGVLRPLDQIQAYRLEMGSRLKTDRGGSLYAYWGQELSKALNAQAKATGAQALVNCASQEYFGAVDVSALHLPIITPQFLELKEGQAKIVSFYAKKARGRWRDLLSRTDCQILRKSWSLIWVDMPINLSNPRQKNRSSCVIIPPRRQIWLSHVG